MHCKPRGIPKSQKSDKCSPGDQATTQHVSPQLFTLSIYPVRTALMQGTMIVVQRWKKITLYCSRVSCVNTRRVYDLLFHRIMPRGLKGTKNNCERNVLNNSTLPRWRCYRIQSSIFIDVNRKELKDVQKNGIISMQASSS